MLACSGKLTAIPTNGRQVVAAVNLPGGAVTSMTFAVSESCKFSTAGFGVFGDLKAGDHVKMEYVQMDGGSNEVKVISVQNAAAATTPKPAAKPPAKKPAAAKKPAPKKK